MGALLTERPFTLLEIHQELWRHLSRELEMLRARRILAGSEFTIRNQLIHIFFDDLINFSKRLWLDFRDLGDDLLYEFAAINMLVELRCDSACQIDLAVCHLYCFAYFYRPDF